MSLTRALAWNTGIQLAGKIVSTVFGIIIVGLLTRYLGQAGFGDYSTANAYLSVFALLLDLGLNVTLVSMLGEHAGDDAYERRCVSATFTLRIVLGLLVFSLAPFVSLLFPYDHTLRLAIIALIGSFFFTVLNQIVIGVQQRHFKMHVVAIAENVGRVVLLIGLLIAMRLGWGLLPIVWFVTLGGFANFLVNIVIAQRYANFSWNFDLAYWKTILTRSWPIGVSIAFNLIYYKADTLVLSVVRSKAEVGLYSAAYRVLDILVTVPFMYAGILLPVISYAWAKKDKKRFAHLIGRSIDVMLLLILPLITGTLILSNHMMILVAGKDFAMSGDILRILIIAAGVIYLNTIFAHAIVALDAQRRMLPIYVAVALITLAGYLLYIPTYGMWAAAWLTVFSETCIGLGSLYISKRQSPVGFHPKVLFASLGASLVMTAVVLPLQNYALPIPIFAGMCVYIACVFLFGGISKATLKEILSIRKESAPIEPLA